VLAFRDELVSLLKTLDREDNAAARGFFLSAWNGTSGYTFDRIIRGRVHIDAACLSL
jgi:putative DNA primase/helicase